MSADKVRQPKTGGSADSYRGYVREKVRQGLADADAG